MEMLSYTSAPLFKSDLAEMYREKKKMQMYSSTPPPNLGYFRECSLALKIRKPLIY